MLDVEGPIETAKQSAESATTDDRKIDQVIDDLKMYRIDLAGLQETKWFEAEMYKVGDSIVLSSGRAVPTSGARHHRGEGVALVLQGPAVKAWRAGGSQWKAWGSRLISATLDCGRRLHVFSCYAPTFAASREEKDSFFNSLQDAISLIPANEPYIMLGDFNACVGSRSVDDQWWYERGPIGYGDLNERVVVFSGY